MSAIDFLNNCSNSLIREEILNYKLFYDLKLAAASQHKFLKILKQEPDIQGSDIIIEDNVDFARKIQVKSRVISKTKKWEIHRILLLPGITQSSDYGFDATLCPAAPGGFILIDVDKSNSNSDDGLTITYLFTDIHIISLMAHGYFSVTKNSQQEALEVLKQLHNSKSKKITVKDNLLVKVRNPNSLINLLGFFQNIEFSSNLWKLNKLIYRASTYFPNGEVYNSDEKYYLKLEIENLKNYHSKTALKILMENTVQ